MDLNKALSWVPVLLVSLIMLGQRSSAAFLINWSPDSYGPDGPWHAVRVKIGNQLVDLLLGRIRVISAVAPQPCGPGIGCPGKKAGFYDATKSHSATRPAAADIPLIEQTVFAPGGGFFGPITTTGKAIPYSDTLRLYTVSEKIKFLDIPQCGIEELTETSVHIPYVLTKASYNISIGFLTIGAPHRAAHLTMGPPKWPQNNPQEYLYNTGNITSPSMAFHIGSPSLGIPPSLVLGGYDRSRVLGTVLSQQLDSSFRWKVNLTDIGIGTEFGPSPFEGGSQSGLLTYFSDGGNALLADIIVQQPYLFLPRSTCDAIARYLPVYFHSSYGVYLWRVHDPQFQKIMSSPSFLYFTMRPYTTTASPIPHPLTIKVPFNLLNLTLESPITTEPTQYFPCAPPPRGTYSQDAFGLGRAFLQAATVGVNWGINDEAGSWWISQAPGPAVLPLNLIPIGVGQTNIFDQGASWRHSWMAFWNRFDTPHPGPGPSSSTTKGGEPSGGLSTGAKAGIGAGVGVVGILLLGLAFICFRRRQRQHRHQTLNSASSPGMTYIRDESSPEISRAEVQNDTPTVHELPTPEDERQFYATFPNERRQFSAPYPRPYPLRQMQQPPMQNITTQYATVHDDRDNIISPLSPSPHSASPWSATAVAEPMSAALQPPPPAYPELDNERAAEMDADRGAELEAPRQVEKSGFLVA